MITNSIDRFLAKQGFSHSKPASEALLAEFDRQMSAGLAAARGSSLAMLPSYISGSEPISPGRKVLVMDAGGTNLRSALVEFDSEGKPQIEDYSTRPMPGSRGAEVDAGEFFDGLAEALEPLAWKADVLGLCFSYAAEITPDCDGRLHFWTKEIRAPEVIGRKIGAGVLDALEDRTGTRLSVRVLNDTTATLLAGGSLGMSRRYSDYIGYILGTGTNIAYAEERSRIAKLAPSGSLPARMIINVESGNFDGVAPSALDLALDRTLSVENYRLEKMLGGAYIGKLGLLTLRLAAEDGLLSPRAGAALHALADLSSKDFDDFCANPFTTGTALDTIPFTDSDRRVAMLLGQHLFRRAARLAAINIAAVVIRTGQGYDPLHPVCITVDGSTFHRTRTARFRSLAEQHLREMLEPRGIAYELVEVPDAPLLGAAVAALQKTRPQSAEIREICG